MTPSLGPPAPDSPSAESSARPPGSHVMIHLSSISAPWQLAVHAPGCPNLALQRLKTQQSASLCPTQNDREIANGSVGPAT